MYKAVIFDLDGTLLDTIADLNTAVNRALAEKGIQAINCQQTLASVGNGFRQLLIRAASYDKNANLSEQEIDELVESYAKHYETCYMDQSKPYPGICLLLDELDKHGIAYAINTNKRQFFAENLIQRFFAKNKILKVMGDHPDYPRKPDPYAAKKLVEYFGFEHKDVLYVGDSEVDLKTANNAGLDVCFVSWGFRSKEEVQDIPHKYTANQAKDLEKIILKGE